MPSSWPIHNHCFTYDWSDCQKWIKTWPFMKFGLVPDYYGKDLATNLPLNKILLESDAPYFPPSALEGFYTKRLDDIGMPGHVWRLALQLAHIKKIDVNQVLEASRKNVSDVYKTIPKWSPEPKRLPLVHDWSDGLGDRNPGLDKHEFNGHRRTLCTNAKISADNLDKLDLIHTCNGTISVTRM